jgi:hypothetical protein
MPYERREAGGDSVIEAEGLATPPEPGSLQDERRGPRGDVICGAASLLLPLGLYLITAAPAPTWLDSGEFLAAGYVLGAAHPPGHPVHVTLVKLLSMVPLGPLAFRGALASAVPAAVACFLLYRLLLALSRRLDDGAPAWLRAPFALLGALLFGSTPALWSQATRIEVYALQVAIVLGGLLPLVCFGLERRGTRDARWLAAAGLAFGLSLANHHFLSLLLLPGVIVLLTEDALGRWQRTLTLLWRGVIPAVAVGLLAYAHLPLRAARAPGAVSLGASPDASTFLWVVSARAFQRAVAEPPTTSVVERIGDSAFLLASQLGPVLAIAALGGLYFLVRQRWGLGLVLVLALLGTWLARSWMGLDIHNPDVLGYLMVAVLVLCVGAARIGPLIVTVLPSRFTVRIGAATVVALGLVIAMTRTVAGSWNEVDLSRARGAELVAATQLGDLPPRSVLITELFSSAFNIWPAQVVEGMRPDVAHFHYTFVGFPTYVQQVYVRHPDLQGILRAALARGALDEQELSSLAQRRPVFVEPLLQTPRNIQPFLLPRGLTWEAGAEPLGLADLTLAAPGHFARWDEIMAVLGPEAQNEQTQRVLLWRLYIDALLFAQRGERAAADEAASRALRLVPNLPDLVRLREALGQGEGRLDVTPFLPRAAGAVVADEPPPRPRVLDF